MSRDGRRVGRVGVIDKMRKKQVCADFFETKMKWPLWKDKRVNLHNGLNLFYKLNLLTSTGDNSYLHGPIPLWCLLKQCLLWNLIVYLAFLATKLKFVSTPSILWYISVRAVTPLQKLLPWGRHWELKQWCENVTKKIIFSLLLSNFIASLYLSKVIKKVESRSSTSAIITSH